MHNTHAQSNSNTSQPWFIPSGPGATTDFLTLAKYYAPFFIAPIALGVFFSIVLTVTSIVSCCCPCKPPLCFNSKIALAIFYSICFAVIIAGSVLAWINTQKVSEGTTIVLNFSDDAFSGLSKFLSDTEAQLKDIKDTFSSAIQPAINGSSTNQTNAVQIQKITEAEVILNNVDYIITSILQPNYTYIIGNLTQLKQGEPDYLNSGSVPDPQQARNPNPESIVDRIILFAALNLTAVQSDYFVALLQNSTAFNASEFAEYFVLPFDFSLPFNLSNGFDLSIDQMLRDAGITGAIEQLKNTVNSAVPFSIPSFDEIKKFVDQNGGIYVIVIAVLCAAIVAAYFFWYPGIVLSMNFCLHIPFACAAFLAIPLGVLVGIHLGIGAATDGFCVNRVEYIHQAAFWLEQQGIADNLGDPARNITLRILSDPYIVLNCKGNETLFELFDIDILRDYGFDQKIDELLNLSSKIPNVTTSDYPNFPNPSPTDPTIATLYTNTTDLINLASSWQQQNTDDMQQLEQVQEQINDFVPTNQTEADMITSLNNTVQILRNLYQNVNDTLDQLSVELILLGEKMDEISAARLEFLLSVFETIRFPFLRIRELKDYLHDAQRRLLSCSWIGDFYSRIIDDAVCQKVSPGLLWVGWAIAGVGFGMFFSAPIIICSKKISSKIT